MTRKKLAETAFTWACGAFVAGAAYLMGYGFLGCMVCAGLAGIAVGVVEGIYGDEDD